MCFEAASDAGSDLLVYEKINSGQSVILPGEMMDP